MIAVGLLQACLPALEEDCSSADDCASGETCVSGVCLGALAPDGQGVDGGGDASAKDAEPRDDLADRSEPPIDAAEDARMADVPVGDASLDGRVADAGGDSGDATPDDAAPDDASLEAGPDAGDAARDACVPVDEICNGLDDDCDGEADEALTRPCFSVAEVQRGRGQCEDGEETCEGGEWSACEGEVLPGEEICDQIDNDCDDETDEPEEAGACECEADEVRACFTGEPADADRGECRSGQQTCLDEAWGPCIGERLPVEEVCDGEDNDCDGQTDEEVPQVGAACAEGLGECLREGLRVCVPGRGVVCELGSPIGDPTDELCDDLDNDCDGEADEDFDLGAQCFHGVGACEAAGEAVCNLDGTVGCVGELGDRHDEICNGQDDDCDGHTDEDFDLGGECEIRINGCVGPGEWACREGGPRCVGDRPEPVQETCNGHDDDCDGRIDEENLGDNLCPGRTFPGTEWACAEGACVHRCEPTRADANDTLQDGCERGCGPVTAGDVLFEHPEAAPDRPSTAALGGAAAVVWTSPENGHHKLFRHDGMLRQFPGRVNVSYRDPALINPDEAWAAVSRAGLDELSMMLLDQAAPAEIPVGAIDVGRPSAAWLSSQDEVVVAAVYTVEREDDGRGLRATLLRGEGVTSNHWVHDNGFAHEGLEGTRPAIAAAPASFVVLAAYDVRTSYALHVYRVTAQGATIASHVMPVTGRPSDLSLIVHGDAALAAFRNGEGVLEVRPILYNPRTNVGDPINIPRAGVAESVTLVNGVSGPILYYLRDGAVWAELLDLDGRVLNQESIEVARPDGPGSILGFHASPRGPSVYGAWTVRQVDQAGAERSQVRAAILDCK